MTTVTFAAAAVTLGLTTAQMTKLMGNPKCPVPATNDGDGNITFQQTDITNFATTMASAVTNGWVLTNADLAEGNWTAEAAGAVGTFYQKGSWPGFALDSLLGEL